ncbi:type IV pilus twitching motility protein PilT [Desulfonatronum sp. SC1]|uniref:type IV pilus twitching motility protein PilT n=1 Tax=Desulfonatronum sp. SC1 TaxID=2109626 RepID=UPI000D313368|nr:ATPase, T2SS/T4P/T4SS family [Desulfonatronum sp. SC1]PTN37537.1 twitching motility protein PilT [Desulfonatronum sp. SC1]
MSSIKSRFTQIVEQCMRNGISDLHIASGHPLVLRKDGKIHIQKGAGFTGTEVDELVKAIATRGHLAMLRDRWSVDMGLSLAGARLRINIFATTRGLSMAIRFLPGCIPDFESLNLHPSLRDFSRAKSGLVLICGSTGSGKSTTIAAMLEAINNERPAHVVTLEDPVEYRFSTCQAFVEQRELGVHFQTFEQGLTDVLREAPDVIMVGELREAPTIRLTLNASESGHLVIATLHAGNAEEALFRLFNAFPPDAQNLVRHQISTSLVGIVIQHLEFFPSEGFQVPVLSIMRSTPAIRGLIREGRTTQLESAIEMGSEDMMFTSNRYRSEFLANNRQLVSPAASFKPSVIKNAQNEHISPLVNIYAAKDDEITGSPPPSGEPRAMKKSTATDFVARQKAKQTNPNGLVMPENLDEIEEYLETLSNLGEKICSRT